MTQYFLVRHDDPPRMLDPDSGFTHGGAHQAVAYPETVPLRRRGAKTKKQPAFPWPRDWVQAYADLNPGAEEEAFRETNFLINRGAGQQIDWTKIAELKKPKLPKFEVLTTGGNCHVALEVIKNQQGVLKVVEVQSFNPKQDPVPDVRTINYKTHSCVAKFTAIHRDGHILNLFDPAVDNYFFVMTRKKGFIDPQRVELFPELGTVTVAAERLNIRNSPGIEGHKIGALEQGTAVELRDYFPSMGNVWARISEGWIALRYQPSPGRQDYYETTSWTMQTTPPLRPMRALPGPLPQVKPTAIAYPGKRNADMLNIFHQAAEGSGEDGWAWVEQAGLTSMAVPRPNLHSNYPGPISEEYTGPRIEDLVGLSEEQQGKLLELL